jgi:hypothetical protein
MPVRAVDMKRVPDNIQTDCGHPHVDGSLMWFAAMITLRRFVAGSGRRLPYHEQTCSRNRRPSLFRQELHPMITHWVPVFSRTGIDSRAIARHEYAVEPLII